MRKEDLPKFGVAVSKDLWAKMWSKVIEEAQRIQSILLNGRLYSRIRYGEEGWAESLPDHCHDCNVRKGQFHVPGCDMEKCPRCGEQLISCSCKKSGKWANFIIPQDLGFEVIE